MNSWLKSSPRQRFCPRKIMIRALGTLLLITVTLAAGVNCAEGRTQPRAHDGVLNLAGWDLEREGPISLNGEWEQYWGRRLTPDDFRSDAPPFSGEIVNIPSPWGHHSAAKTPQGDLGFATFRLRIVNISPNKLQAALRITEVWSAYRLWVNGQLIAESGTVGATEQSEIPRPSLQTPHFTLRDGPLDLVMQVSNFHHNVGGISFPILLGPEQAIETEQVRHWVLMALFLGGLLGMGFYQIALFTLRRKDQSSLFLGLYSLAWFTHILTSQNSGWIISLFLPNLSWETLTRLSILGYYLSCPLGLIFFRTLFPQECPAYATRWYTTGALGFSLVMALAPIRVATSTIPLYHIFALLGIAFSLYVLSKAVARHREGAGTILTGFGCLALSGINDILYDLRYVDTGSTIHLGVLSLIFAQAFAIARRSSTAFRSVKKLSIELEEKNLALAHFDKLKDEFLANTSHELRTPLSGIVGLAEGMLGGSAGEIPAKATKTLVMITASARRLAALVNDILDFSRLKNRDIILNRLPLDLRSVAETVLELSRPLAQGKPLVLVNAIPFGLPAVDADEDRLQQILFNLIGNSIKFTNRGEVVVSAAAIGESLEISVTDTGIGIPPEKLEQIFLSFEQVDSSATRSYGGTGLGLPITRDLIALHGGTVSVVSELGAGSTFRFSLPTTSLPAILPTPSKVGQVMPATLDMSTMEDPVGVSPEGKGLPTVLVVDDEPINLQVAISQLGPAGIAVTTATNGLDALAMIEAGYVPDLVLLDLMMPKMSGFEVCRRLRERYPPSKMPIIIVTARNRVSDLVEGFAVGAGDYLTKPFSREELLARVSAHLQLRESFATIEENLRLKQELTRRKETEQELRCMQRRLSGLLQVVPDALLAVNQSEEIAFCNRAFENLLGKDLDLLGRDIRTVLPTEAVEMLRSLFNLEPGVEPGKSATIITSITQASGARTPVAAMGIGVELEEEIIVVVTLRPGDSSNFEDTEVPSIMEELSRRRRTLAVLENSLDFDRLPLEPDALREVRAIESAIERTRQDLGSPSEAKRRYLAVEIMKLALACWEQTTGKTKIDLAIESRLWKVYTNQDGWDRAQTLDRYLDIGTLPANPRWRKIVATGDFVLTAVGLDSPLQQRLHTMLIRLTTP